MDTIYLFNTLSRRKQAFTPLVPGQVGMYSCGPTVYQYASIGNFRTYVFSDILRRTLEYNGLNVKQVMNVTDVGHLVSDADEGEDKMQVAAEKEKRTPWEIAGYYTSIFVKDMNLLNIEHPEILVPATGHIPEMISMVEGLLEKGYAYEISDGIYFDISKFPEYGKLSGLKVEDQLAGARVEANPEKRHPADFALWKKAAKAHIMQWESPWGMGYPGWHIECSAMGRKYLGDQFDIHTGGVDHIPVHHENEIAQSQACFGKTPARFWMHGEFLQVDGGKMSKSLRNTYTLDDLAAKGFEPPAFRYFCFSAHYRSKLNFTWEALASAQTGLRSLRRFVQKSASEKTGPRAGSGFEIVGGAERETKPIGKAGADANTDADAKYEGFFKQFKEAINDDLNMPRAVAVLWDATKANLGPRLLDLANQFDRVLALDLATGKSRDEGEALGSAGISEEALAILEERKAARLAKDWAKSDALRDRLRGMGYAVKDTKEGYEVTRI